MMSLLIVDFSIFEKSTLIFSNEQKEILSLILKSENIEDFMELKKYLKINVFKYLPLRIMLLQREIIKQKNKLSVRENSKITYNTFM
ncbi:hypothetical protein [Spiroplasma taiwanense]|uniref:Uncharacterized protein n=1 Tax=Spiroplasma taiwanense CT-1 TaxID=1276220 RepID=S5LTG0_9MOLU|nr:hypothetical protein [Spiroplasma taiwanense]AGR40994.1 hypothetical protein STAIW_v1c03360 [Spiroplasma taiwanense CT-1]